MAVPILDVSGVGAATFRAGIREGRRTDVSATQVLLVLADALHANGGKWTKSL